MHGRKPVSAWMHEIHIQPAAEADLIAIWRTSYERWGLMQADRYLDEVNEGIAVLAGNPLLGTDCSWIRAGYRRLTIQHHNVYYRVIIMRIEIIRVLHERMEPERHLALDEA